MHEKTTYETVCEVKQIVDALQPGYYRTAVNPFEALENQQGNCFSAAVIGATALHCLYHIESSIAWSERLNGTLVPQTIDNKNQYRSTPLNIVHAELLVPRAVDQYDVLGLCYGMNVRDGCGGDVFMKVEEGGGIIRNYNFLDEDPQNTDVMGLSEQNADKPLVYIANDDEIIPTQEGRDLGLASMDWEFAANKFLAQIDQPEIDIDKLTEFFLAKHEALKDFQKTE